MSYFEWTQNLQQFRWDERDNVSLRLAAFATAVEAVATAEALRGYI